MTALLGLLAIAGYQNRDKLAELFREAQAKYGASGPGGSQEGRAGTVGNLGGFLSGTSVGGLLSGGLRDLVESFKSRGQVTIATPGAPSRTPSSAYCRAPGQAAE
jgi:uncharacterized protein YidB (DUF937 family)